MKKAYFSILAVETFFLPILWLTPVSITGYWTDYICFIGIALLSQRYVINTKEHYHSFVRMLSKTIHLLYLSIGISVSSLLMIIILLFGGVTPNINEIHWDGIWLEITYFQPVGAWGCGIGSSWKTRTLIMFPWIEYEIANTNCLQSHGDLQ